MSRRLPHSERVPPMVAGRYAANVHASEACNEIHAVGSREDLMPRDRLPFVPVSKGVWPLLAGQWVAGAQRVQSEGLRVFV